MKKDQKDQIKQMTDSALSKRLSELQKEIVETRLKLVIGEEKNLRKKKILGHTFAYIKMIQSERKLAGDTKAKPESAVKQVSKSEIKSAK